MVAILRKDIMRLMMTEHIMPRVWMHTNSRGEKGQCTVPKRLAKYGWWKCQQSNTRVSPKNACTYYQQLSIKSRGSQRDKYPEEECMGFWLSLRILDSWYVGVLY